LAGKPYETRRRKGHWQRRCFGVLHKGEWVNFENFRPRSKAKYKTRKNGSVGLRSECRACENAVRNNAANPRILSGYVPISRYWPFILEMKFRLGSREAARRIGIGHGTWARWQNGNIRQIQRESAKRILVALREVRANNEVRSRRNIRRGSKMRGEPESPPANRHDFYKPTGDVELEARSNYRKNNIEQQRAVERERARRKRLARG
jgi:hypothetical protein